MNIPALLRRLFFVSANDSDPKLEDMSKSKSDKSPVKADATVENQDVADTNVPVSIETETKPLPDTMEAVTDEMERWKDIALRAQADLDNYRKRMAREMADSRAYANQSLLENLLPILDNFDMGLAAARAESEQSSIYLGMNMVLRQMQDFLKQQGVETIPETGPFDPKIHEAVSQEQHPEIPEGNIVRTYRKGYRQKDRLLRPATVVVSQGPPEADSAGHPDLSTVASFA